MADLSTTVLTYLAATHRLNADAEVSGPELQRELSLDAATLTECVTQLADQGLVERARFLSNMWLRITDKGLMTLARDRESPA